MSTTSKPTSKRARLALTALVLSLTLPTFGRAHSTTENAFFDDFQKAGPLAGRTVRDPWETKTGTWTVVDQTFPDAPIVGDPNRVLVQTSRAITPNEPMTFVRARAFREFTATVTAAFVDPVTASGDPAPNSSLGVVFRAPITDDIADKDNLYLFSAEVTGVQNGFPTGKALVLFKRVGRTYFMVRQQVVPTWADLTKAHEYKVVAGGGRILCYFDGRLVLEYTDKALGDAVVDEDEMPGLPYESGAVGLRTSSARAWFDNFRVVGNDAYEGRAAAFDGSAQYGDASPNVRRGTSVYVSSDLRRAGVVAADTGFNYHDHSNFDDAVVRSVDNPSGGNPSAGASLRSRGTGDTVTSTARLMGIDATISDPDNKARVLFEAHTAEAIASASCDSTRSAVNVVKGLISIELVGVDPRGGDLKVGPFPIEGSYKENTLIVGGEMPFRFQVWAHKTTRSSEPKRVDLSAISVIVGGSGKINGWQPAPGVRIPETTVPSIPLEISIANVVAGRYCR